MSDSDLRGFEQFWPYYLNEHKKPGTRALHVAGTTLGLAAVAAAAISRRPAWLLAAPVLGYGLAWVSHFFIEHNRPAAWKYPLWSLRGDLKMWAMTVAGTLDAEIIRVTTSNGVHGKNGGERAPGYVTADPQTFN